MLFELADPAQIVSVTALSRDEELSYFADRARSVAVNHGLAEEVIALQPDLILAGRYTATTTSALLSRLGYNVMTFEPTLSFADFRRTFLRLGKAIGVEHKATELLREMDRDLARFNLPAVGSRPRAIVYRPNGFSPGSRSLANDILNAAGLVNLAAEFGIEFGGFVALERLVIAAPDIVLFGGRAARYPALAELILAHPALSTGDGAARIATVSRPLRIDLAEKYWTCGGTFVVEAVAQLNALASR